MPQAPGVRRAVIAALAMVAAMVLAACDQEITATVKADGTVSGTWILAESDVKIQSEADLGDPAGSDPDPDYTFDDALADYRTNMSVVIGSAFPVAVLSNWANDGYSGVMGTFTDITYEEFAAGIASGLTLGGAPTNATLTKVSDRYVFGVTNLDTTLRGNPSLHSSSGGGAPIEFNSITLNFPVRVASSNGSIHGTSVTWDLAAHPGLTTLFADTGKATVTVAGAFKKSGKAKVGKTVKIKAPAATTPGVTRSYTWYAGSKPITGATTAKLKLKAAQKGKVVAVKVSYAKPDYYTFTKTITIGKVS